MENFAVILPDSDLAVCSAGFVIGLDMHRLNLEVELGLACSLIGNTRLPPNRWARDANRHGEHHPGSTPESNLQNRQVPRAVQTEAVLFTRDA